MKALPVGRRGGWLAGPPRQGSLEPGYALARGLLIPWLAGCFRWHFEGAEHIPPSGPAIIASNHVSLFDPLALAYAVHRHGRRPRFLGKSSLFEAPLVGGVLRGAGQIRVDRGTSRAVNSLAYAEEAVARGELVVIFPEGTTTKARDLTPLPPKTGMARLALRSGLSVIPCATWGGTWVWSYHLGFRPGFGKDVWVRFGPPVSFKEYEGRQEDPKAWDEIGKTVMDEIAVLLAGLRAAKPWTPRGLTRRAARKFGPQD